MADVVLTAATFHVATQYECLCRAGGADTTQIAAPVSGKQGIVATNGVGSRGVESK